MVDSFRDSTTPDGRDVRRDAAEVQVPEEQHQCGSFRSMILLTVPVAGSRHGGLTRLAIPPGPEKRSTSQSTHFVRTSSGQSFLSMFSTPRVAQGQSPSPDGVVVAGFACLASRDSSCPLRFSTSDISAAIARARTSSHKPSRRQGHTNFSSGKLAGLERQHRSVCSTRYLRE